MAKWDDLTQEQKDTLFLELTALGIPLTEIPKMDFNLDNHLESE